MKYSTAIQCALTLSIIEVVAFPAALFDMMTMADDSTTIEQAAAAIKKLKEKRFTPPSPGFNAAQQYVWNQGVHAFVLPTSLLVTSVVHVLVCLRWLNITIGETDNGV